MLKIPSSESYSEKKESFMTAVSNFDLEISVVVTLCMTETGLRWKKDTDHRAGHGAE